MASGGPGAPSVERVIQEGYCKAAAIILESRLPTTTSAGGGAARGRAWFNLEVAEVEGAAKALERWRREAGLPLVLEIFLQPWGAQALAATGGQDRVETLLERWVVHHYPQLPEGASALSRSQLSRLNPASVYKRLVITLRSLYTYARVLPAYRMARACKRQRGANFSLGYRLHSTLPGRGAPGAPGTRRMQAFSFGGVDTPYGQFRIGVDYQPASTVTILEQTTSPPPLPQIIADYVGGGSSGGGALGDGAREPLRHAMSAVAFPGAPAAASTASAALPQQQAPLASSPGGGGAPPGSSPRPGGMPIRRSWSTSLRAASPGRTLSQPPSELPSPVSARDTPYGSAPQAVSLPAMLRALSSTPGSKYVVGSPAGRPPLAKPPRAATAPMAAPPGRPDARAALPSSSGGGGALRSAAAADDGDDGESEGGSTPRAGSAGSSARQSSAPVSIPGRAGLTTAQGRRLRSSNDLWAMQQAAAQRKPLSAPAVSHMQQAMAGGGGAAGTAAAAAPGEPGSSGRSPGAASSAEPSPPPPQRLAAIPGTVDSESSGSAASSLYPTSCSPQLPFAFTPSAQSLASFGARGPLQESARLERMSPRLGRALSGAGSVPQQAAAAALAAQQQQQRLQQRAAATSAAASPAGPASFSPSSAGSSGGGAGSSGAVTGREVPAHTALMRRPSWSARSSYGGLPGEASQQGVGYSVSPMQDPTLESMLAGSTPRQFTLASGLPSPLAGAALGGRAPGTAAGMPGAGPLTRVGSTASAYGASQPPLLTFPSGGASGGGDEGDEMPFALDDSSTSPLKPCSPAPASPALPLTAPPPGPAHAGAVASAGAAAGQAAALPAAAVDTDAAVGAFVRLIQEAPPLRLHASQPPTRAASADLAAARLGAPGTSSGSDSSGATCLSDGRGLTLQAGLRRFSELRERLRARGVPLGPLPTEA